MKNVYRGGSTEGEWGVRRLCLDCVAFVYSARLGSSCRGRRGTDISLPPPLMTKVARTNDLADFHWEIRAAQSNACPAYTSARGLWIIFLARWFSLQALIFPAKRGAHLSTMSKKNTHNYIITQAYNYTIYVCVCVAHIICSQIAFVNQVNWKRVFEFN